jgi:hypothetical protein
MKIVVRLNDGSVRQYVYDHPLTHEEATSLIKGEIPEAKTILIEAK